jgi:hypothetical protein
MMGGWKSQDKRPLFAQGGRDMIKRLANMLELLSVGAMFVGLYQDNPWAVGLGAVIFAVCLTLTWLDGRGKNRQEEA